MLFKSISTKEKVLLLEYFYKGRDGQYAVSIRPALVIVKSFEKSYLEAWTKKKWYKRKNRKNVYTLKSEILLRLIFDTPLYSSCSLFVSYKACR